MNTIPCPCCGALLRIEAAGLARRVDRPHGPGNLPPQPWTIDRARAFTMPIGKYKGRTIAQIGLADPAYLEWVADNLDRNVQKAAQVYLEHDRGSTAKKDAPADEFDEFGGG